MNDSPLRPLTAALAAADEQAFASLLDRHYGPMLRFARAGAPDEASAISGVHRAWETALDEDESPDAFPSLAAWLFSLVQFELEADPVAADWDAATDIDPGVLEQEGHPWAGHWRDEAMPAPWSQNGTTRSEAIEQGLRELPSALAQLLVLHDVERLTSLEIAAALGLERESQLALLHAARTMLRRAVDKRIALSAKSL